MQLTLRNLLACRFTLVAVFVLLASCSSLKSSRNYTKLSDADLHHVADSLAQAYIITDSHVDLPYRLKIKHFRLEREYLGIPISTTEGNFDYERAKKGGLDAPFMSIYIPSSYQKLPDMGKALADSLINMIRGIAENIPDKFALANSVDDVQKNFKEGKISLPMGMENGAPIGNDLAN